MTGEEREVLRRLVSDKARALVDVSRVRCCGWCGGEYEAVRVNQRFCRVQCRKRGWESATEKGRVWRAEKKRQQRARQRARRQAFVEIQRVVERGGSLDDVRLVVEAAA